MTFFPKDVKFPLMLDVYELCTTELQEKMLPIRSKFKEVEDKKLEKQHQKVLISPVISFLPLMINLVAPHTKLNYKLLNFVVVLFCFSWWRDLIWPRKWSMSLFHSQMVCCYMTFTLLNGGIYTEMLLTLSKSRFFQNYITFLYPDWLWASP